MEGARKIPTLQVRLPEQLKVWLKHKSVDNRRSLNSEVVTRLEESRAMELSQLQRDSVKRQ
ncbi:Arc family DNA-binding protein [Glaciimonas immobilis]|uniref:Arc-like DNA binding domain-containing protein n=1 Tax=Glaciimonas immobilis TaxID=728004 RepID=A0A840RLI9_9BURK|nr:Arc family DNA-binding protein [Glaciimonas immobilis]MBB5198623.1 hypothetical protein [Glaciimonas immobilis]